MSKLENLDLDGSWTIFLDRDGTINKRIMGSYVSKPEDFHFLPGVLKAIKDFSKLFYKVLIVTNQQGIGKELMTHQDLQKVHEKMMMSIDHFGGKIDQIYYCPHLAALNPLCRKPNPGMALQAKEDFAYINFSRSIMVGDTESDILFGKRLKMFSVLIQGDKEKNTFGADLVVNGLEELALILKSIIR